jgi:hypothetical protein
MLTQKMLSILRFINDQHTYCSPTAIGMILGNKNYTSASSWASSTCLRLVDKGLLKRNNKGWYKLHECEVYSR